MIRRVLKIFSFSILWLIFFWVFLVLGFPHYNAKGWLAERVGRELNASVTIENLKVMWDLGIKLNGISIESQKQKVSDLQASPINNDFMVKLDSLHVKPRPLSLIRLRPGVDFKGSTPSGGTFYGSYASQSIAASFSDISFKDISISTLPLPSTSSVSGSGELKIIKGKGTIDIEVTGIPGGTQKLKLSAGEAAGLDGKVKVAVSLPKL